MVLLPVLEGLHSAEAFNPAFLSAFLERIRVIEGNPAGCADLLRGKVVATVFEEPSTRTRLSFEVAAHRLGAGVISVADPKSSSSAKGESLHDAAKVIGSYVDLLVWRHPRDGASRLVAQAAGVPTINAGDGRLGHPSQTLVDLYTMYREWGSFEGRTVGILGDLRYGRTARSLAWGLSLLGARVVPLPAPGLDWEAGFEERVCERSAHRSVRVSHDLVKSWTGVGEARMLEPQGWTQSHLFGEIPQLEKLDALYLTRLQSERGAQLGNGVYPGLTMEQLDNPLLEDCLILHPLPRLSEVPVAVDQDPRARYFEQARFGPWVRMGLFLAMMGPDEWSMPPLTALPAGSSDHQLGPCANTNCITRQEGVPVPWRIAGRNQRSFLCAFCDTRIEVAYVGCRSSMRLHPVHSQAVMKIRPENLRPFADRVRAKVDGYIWAGN